MPRHQKNHLTLGLEAMLNNPATNPFASVEGYKGFKEVISASELPMTEVFRHIGKNKKSKKPKEPSKEEQSKARLEKLEAETEKQ